MDQVCLIQIQLSVLSWQKQKSWLIQQRCFKLQPLLADLQLHEPFCLPGKLSFGNENPPSVLQNPIQKIRRKSGLCDFRQGMIAGSWIIKGASFSEQLPNMARNILKCGRKPLFYRNSMKRLKCISSNVCKHKCQCARFFGGLLVFFFKIFCVCV